MSGVVAEMDKGTAQNATAAEQSSAAANELSAQSDELATLVRSFTLALDGGAVSDAVPRRGAASRLRRSSATSTSCTRT